MPANMKAFHHFVETGEFTYEVGINEPPHPDFSVACRLEEIAMSTCPSGCKIMADPRSRVRVLVHNPAYGCRVTV